MAGKFIRCAPHLPVKNLSETLDYYRDVLGFQEEWKFGAKDGGARRDELRVLFEENPAFATTINNDSHRLSLLWFVEDIDSVYKDFQSRKIVISDPLKLHPYGLREFSFIDINGYYIRVAEHSEKEKSTMTKNN